MEVAYITAYSYMTNITTTTIHNNKNNNNNKNKNDIGLRFPVQKQSQAAEPQRCVLLIDAWLASTEAVRAPAEAPYSLVAPLTRYGAFSNKQLATPMW